MDSYIKEGTATLKANMRLLDEKRVALSTSLVGVDSATKLLRVFQGALEKLEDTSVSEKNKVLLLDKLNVTYLMIPDIK